MVSLFPVTNLFSRDEYTYEGISKRIQELCFKTQEEVVS